MGDTATTYESHPPKSALERLISALSLHGVDPDKIGGGGVAEQAGHMARVPWAKVTLNSGRVVLINLANVESVELA